jgi:DNA-directed RNA polymerase subunit E'/Rpb7
MAPCTRALLLQLLPEDFEFDSSADPAFVTRDQEQRIREGVEVRIRVVGVRVDADNIVSGRMVGEGSQPWPSPLLAGAAARQTMAHGTEPPPPSC